MNKKTQMIPLQFEQTFQYVRDQLHDGNTLARELLINTDFENGDFVALLPPSADKTKIHRFQAGGISKSNPMEKVFFQGKAYPGRKKADSISQLVQCLKNALHSGRCCFFEDMIHRKSDPIAPELQKHVFYFQKEVYLQIKESEFSKEVAKKIINYADAQWYYMNIVSDSLAEIHKNMTKEQLHSLALKTTLISIGAYDMEGFVLWKRFSNNATRNK